MQDGNSFIPSGDKYGSPTKSALEVLNTLQNKTSDFNSLLEEVEQILRNVKKQKELHRPDQGQMMTSGPQIDHEIIEGCISCAMKVFELARSSVPKR